MKTRKEYILADANEKAKQARDKKAQYEESK